MSLDLGTGVTIDVAGVALSQKYIVAVLLGIAICEDVFFLFFCFCLSSDQCTMCLDDLLFWSCDFLGVSLPTKGSGP